jgi:hypothetical protein
LKHWILNLAEVEVTKMNNLLEKVEGMMATILDMMDVEPGSDAAANVVEDELSRDTDINSDAHHKLIELCW